MTERVLHDLKNTVARQLFIAEMGHTGMSWDEVYGHDDGTSSWHTKAGRFLEGWWDPDKPYVVMDLADDRMWLAAEYPL